MGLQFNLQSYNSVSYVDVVALQLGLQRLPSETADTFLDRLYQAASNVRDHTFQGTVDQIAFELGLTVSVGMTISCFDPTVLVTVSFGQMMITQGMVQTVIPTVTIDADNYWTWRMLSDVVSDINTQTPCTAVLKGADGLAWQLANQSSLAPVSVIHTWSLPRVHNIKISPRAGPRTPLAPYPASRSPNPPGHSLPAEQHITLPRPREAPDPPSHLIFPGPRATSPPSYSLPPGAHLNLPARDPRPLSPPTRLPDSPDLPSPHTPLSSRTRKGSSPTQLLPPPPPPVYPLPAAPVATRLPASGYPPRRPLGRSKIVVF